MIIDSPGVGESEKMDQILMAYLPKAFAFIYVICSSNAGGIQKDRVCIKSHLKLCTAIILIFTAVLQSRVSVS